MIEISSFFSGFFTAVGSGIATLYLLFRHYRKITFSINLDKLKETGYYLIEALEDMKLSDEERLTILNKLKDAITEEARIVKIGLDEIKEVKPDEIVNAIKALYPAVQVKAVSDGKYYTVSEKRWREIIKSDFIERKKYLAERYDCLLPDTPVIVLKNGCPEIVEIQDLSASSRILDYDPENNKLRWTRVNWVASKYSSKDIITIKRPEGFLQCTEDHKFYRAKKWYRIGELIKHFKKANLTTAPVWEVFKSNNELIDRELAWAYGLFMAEGSAGIGRTSTTEHSYQWKIDCGNRDALERGKVALEDAFGVPMRIVLYDSNKVGRIVGGITRKTDIYTLKARGYGNSKKLALIFKELFYTSSNQKKVPSEVLLSNVKIAKAFLEGYITGDGTRTSRMRKGGREGYLAAIKSRAGLLGLQILCKNLGWANSISYDKRRDCPLISIYPDGIEKVHKFTNHLRARGVWARQPFIRENRGVIGVYDINTETHTFVASTYLVHNCDDYSRSFVARVIENYGLNACGIVWGWMTEGAYHAWNFIYTSEGRLLWYEAQNDSLFVPTGEKYKYEARDIFM